MYILVLVTIYSSALSSATQHAMPPEFGANWVTECLNSRIPVPTLLYVRYSVIQKDYKKNIVKKNILN